MEGIKGNMRGSLLKRESMEGGVQAKKGVNQGEEVIESGVGGEQVRDGVDQE